MHLRYFPVGERLQEPPPGAQEVSAIFEIPPNLIGPTDIEKALGKLQVRPERRVLRRVDGASRGPKVGTCGVEGTGVEREPTFHDFSRCIRHFVSTAKWSKGHGMSRAAFGSSILVATVLLVGCIPPKNAIAPGDSERVEGLNVPDVSLEKCGMAEGEAKVVKASFTFDGQQNVSRVRVEPGAPSRSDLVPSPALCRCLETELAATRVSKGHFTPGSR